MLSIGKLATGQANHYPRQVGGRIDRATSVASGVEDYYLSEGEAAGEWIGTGPLALGMDGKVDGEALHRVLAGEDPASGDPLRSTRGTRVPGFDLTFSAPKSVSVLFGIWDDDVREHIQQGHDQAVADALGYLERVAASARRGHAGVESVAGEGFVAAAFRHRTSRAGDPQIHTHVLVANLVRCHDGRWSAADARRIYAHAKTAGYLYEASLRRELTARLGFEWTDVRNGIADVVGVPVAVRQAFSRRRAEIEAELERRGSWSAAAAQAAALDTRRSKDRLIDPRLLADEWHARAEVNGLTAQVVERVFNRATVSAVETGMSHRVMDELASPHGLTRAWSSFSRRDTIRALCERLPAASDVSSEAIERLADMFLASDRAVPLLGPGRPLDDPLRRGDGRVAPLLRDELRYSTPELLAIEQRIVDMALHNGPLRVGLAAADWVEAAVGRRPFLSAEQAQMVRRLTGEGGQIVAVVGKAGTGKTTALSAAREAWVASGLKVVGVAVARRAARELQDSAGIPSTSVAALLLELRRGGRFALEPGTVVVLDEASMVSSRDLGELVEHVVNAGGKLVLCGDHRQLPSIRAGGAFRAIVARTDAIELTHNRRQQEQWERDALDTLREGVASKAIRVYEAHERLVIGGDRDALMERLVSDWWVAGRPDHTAMIALRRADVRRLNGQARALMRDAGMLGPDVPFRCGTFAIGDRVVVRRNDRRLGTANGETGLVEAVDDARGNIGARGGAARSATASLSRLIAESTDRSACIRHHWPHRAGDDSRAGVRAREPGHVP